MLDRAAGLRQRERGVGESRARIFTISCKEPNPTGSRPRDLIGLSKPTHENLTPEHAGVGKEEEARKHGRGNEGNNGNPGGSEQEATKEAWRRQKKGKEPKPRKPRMF